MDTTLKTLLLATDGSPDAALAARAAVMLARGAGASLHVVHVWHYTPAYAGLEVSAGGSSMLFAADEQLAREVLAGAVASLEREGMTIAGQHLRQGRPAIEIAAVADEIGADLIVMGSRGLGPIKRLVLGSVADETVHTATVPTLVIRGGDDAWPPARIVIGDDGSPAAARAATVAATIGHLCGASGVIVRTYPPLPSRFQMADPLVGIGSTREERPGVLTPQQLRDEAIGRAELDLAARATALARQFGTVPEVLVLTDTPAATLLSVAGARGPALIAVGSRGLGTFQRLRLGSVSTAVLHAAEGPVLVVPPQREGAAAPEEAQRGAAVPV